MSPVELKNAEWAKMGCLHLSVFVVGLFFCVSLYLLYFDELSIVSTLSVHFIVSVCLERVEIKT